MEHEQDLAVVREVYDAFARADVPRIMALFAPTGTVVQSPQLPWGGTHTGHEGLGRFLTTLTGLVEPLRPVSLDVIRLVGRARSTLRAGVAAAPEASLLPLARALDHLEAAARLFALEASCDGESWR